jgi:hypothetical protein
MDLIGVEKRPERRARRIVKGQIVDGKARRTGGRGIRAANFAPHPIRQGEPIVARDLVADPDGRLDGAR